MKNSVPTAQTETKTLFDAPTNWRPRGSYLLLVPTVDAEVTTGGIIVPDAVRRKAQSGFIFLKGPDVPADLWIGDEVFFEQHQEYRIVLDDNNEEAVVVDAYKIILSQRPLPAPAETSQPMRVKFAYANDIDISRMVGETDTGYNGRMARLAPEGFYWNGLTEDFERYPDQDQMSPTESPTPSSEDEGDGITARTGLMP